MKKKYKIVSPIRFFIFVLTMVIAVTFSVYAHCISDSEAASYKSYKEIEVCDGDTLWSIAENNCDSNIDTRLLIKEISDINDLSSEKDLNIGDKIFIPVLSENASEKF